MGRLYRPESEPPESDGEEYPGEFGRIYVREADAEVVTEPAQADDEAVVVEEPAEPAPAARGKRSK